MNPYAIQSPALISFSGGRTSGFMLRHILDAHGGAIPRGVCFAFANTGKEREETLDFVNEVETRWNIPISWIEYANADGKHSYKIVSYETASRGGEPFDALIESKQFLPNPVTRFCTQELKIRPLKKWMVASGYTQWDCALGLRADEPGRVAKAKKSCAKERWTNIMPMADAGHSLADVMSFWADQPFDLKLRPDEGNCDLCFLKGRVKISRLMRERPESAKWWIENEDKSLGRAISKKNNLFRSDRPRYAHLLQIVRDQPEFADFGNVDCDELDTCHCTD